VKKKSTSKIHIAIDALGIDDVGGARSVTLPLLKRVYQIKQDWHFTCFLTKYEEELNFQNVKQVILPLSKGLISRLIFQFVIFLYVSFNKIDLTHFIKSQGNLLFHSKKVLTIYDCTILKFPSYFSLASRLFWRYIQPLICKSMDRIITISHDAKSEIITYLKVPQEKISVIYPAPQFQPDFLLTNSLEKTVREKYNLSEDFLLYIGQIGMKKNLITLVKAYNILKKKYLISLPLILVGPRYYLSDAGEIFTAVENYNLRKNIRYLGTVDKHELYIILKHAMLLLFPSIHEGFGIPIVEAMQLGVPVIASNTSVMPEVLDHAGVLIDNFLSPEAWAEEINSLIHLPQRRMELSLQGLERSKAFSWDASAEKLVQVYETLLETDITNK